MPTTREGCVHLGEYLKSCIQDFQWGGCFCRQIKEMLEQSWLGRTPNEADGSFLCFLLQYCANLSQECP